MILIYKYITIFVESFVNIYYNYLWVLEEVIMIIFFVLSFLNIFKIFVRNMYCFCD